jgi:glyoxylase-like metal-dependent hydrolase (beta-lactamase superfamily II)
MVRIKTFVFNPFEENTYLLMDETGVTVIVDPGCYDAEEQHVLKTYINENDLKISALLNTHAHIDHVLGNAYVKETYEVQLHMNRGDLPVLHANPALAGMYGFPEYKMIEPDHFPEEGEQIKFGNSTLEVLTVPGHSPGHLAFYDRQNGYVVVGDVLFSGSIGRTDLPGGDFDTLIDSIHRKLFPLGDAVRVYPGHGPVTEIGIEKRSNPFCALPQ